MFHKDNAVIQQQYHNILIGLQSKTHSNAAEVNANRVMQVKKNE